MKRSWIKYLLVVSVCCVGCPGGYDNKLDSAGPIMDGVKWDTTGGGKKDGWPVTDMPWQPKDGPVPPDTHIPWPDVTYPDSKPASDLFPWPPDQGGYSPSPFGCHLDADCFGVKCCSTPWGVKLCAPVCNY